MATLYRLILFFSATFTATLPVGATDPEPRRGRVLLLDNEHIVEGDIEYLRGQYHIRHTIGESWMPGNRVLRLCADREEAYRYLRGRANLDDPDERLRLARWCHGQGLHKQALDNVSEAVQLRPGHEESRRLLSSLRRVATTMPAAPSSARAETAETVTIPELNAEALGLFATKVQPILMNACANCHAAGRGGAFKLMRTSASSTAIRRPLQQNLAAVLGQINLQQPQISPLLTKAITAHGDVSQAPLAGRQIAAYHALEEWVNTTLAHNPHLREHTALVPTSGGNPPALSPRPARKPVETSVPRPTLSPGTGAKPATADHVTTVPGGQFATDRPNPSPVPAGPVDPFDPVQFNRESRDQKQ
jgi:hypothetical protein